MPNKSSVGVRERIKAATRTTYVSILVNIVLTVLQIVFGLITSSYSLVADALHSLSDLV